jgi:uncharacterized membrane protein YeaQ/YmgE (transglycosylase-associated protein family)
MTSAATTSTIDVGPTNPIEALSATTQVGIPSTHSYNAHLAATATVPQAQGGRMPTSLFLHSVQDRVVIVEWQHGILYWILIGLIAGWLAGKIARGAGYGCVTDVILGLVGSVLGGWLFMKLGILGGGTLYSLAAATVGAVILVTIVHLFAGNSR